MKWRCTECDNIVHELLSAPNPFDTTETISGCPVCRSVECFRLVCDEPDCEQLVSAGWPTPEGGYRRTCGKHWQR